MDQRWRIQLLEGLRAECGDRVITRFRSQRTAALLAYLAYFRDQTHPRQLLSELLWPAWDPELARHNLSVALSSLREQLELPGLPTHAVILSDRFSVGLNREVVTTDVAEFEGVLRSAAGEAERARFLSEAVELYRGRLLPGFYEEWILREQQRLDELFFQALRDLIGDLEQADDLEGAIRYARRAVAADPLREEAQHELIRILAAAGQPGAALRQYRELERILKQELNAVPGAATRALVNRIQRGDTARAAKVPRRDPQPDRPTAAPPVPFILSSAAELEPVGGAVPLNSRFYVVRPTDEKFAAAIARRDSIVLVKGPRQVGKTSSLARGLHQARQMGARVVLTDLEAFNTSHLESADTLLLALAQSIADQLDLPISPADLWEPRRGASPNFRRFMQRHVLEAVSPPLVWALDPVDRLFDFDYSSDIFALFRSWHNERALDPDCPWWRLTLAMAYATEVHLFITDLSKSPFNVGTRLTLEDFTLEHVADLNCRYGSPLKDPAELKRFFHLVGGHPDLVRRGLHEMVTSGTDIAVFEARGSSDDWIYGDHLQRMLALLTRDDALCDVMRGVLAGRAHPTSGSFYRLRSAGLLAGESEEQARPRCQLYASYLRRYLL